jgi:hypothetical protein
MSDKPDESKKYTANEMMICVAARLMQDGTTAFIGTGIPMLAAALAQRLYTPNLIAVFEFGGSARSSPICLSLLGNRALSIVLWRPPVSATSWKQHSAGSSTTAFWVALRSTALAI